MTEMHKYTYKSQKVKSENPLHAHYTNTHTLHLHTHTTHNETQMVFMRGSQDQLSLPLLLAVDTGLLLAGYALAICTQPLHMLHSKKGTFFSTLGWLCLCAASLRVISPVLRTLTVSYSDDTIYALALVLLGFHLVFHDYAAAAAAAATVVATTTTTARVSTSSSSDSGNSSGVYRQRLAEPVGATGAGAGGAETSSCHASTHRLAKRPPSAESSSSSSAADSSRAHIQTDIHTHIAPPSAESPYSSESSDHSADMAAAAVLIPVEAAQFHGAFSLNAALFATVLLASRLESNEMVFAFVFLAIELFAFFPLARHLVRRQSVVLHLVVTLLLVVGTVVALVTTSTSGAASRVGEGEGESKGGNERTLLVVYLMTVVFVMVVCPVWLQHIYKYKNTIRGPWDVAEIEKEERERN